MLVSGATTDGTVAPNKTNFLADAARASVTACFIVSKRVAGGGGGLVAMCIVYLLALHSPKLH